MSKEKIIVALDVENAQIAEEIISELQPHVGAFKIGLQLFTAEGAAFVRKLTEKQIKIFLDVKFHDIPNTVAKAAIEAAKLGVWLFNIHTLGGAEMMRQTSIEVSEFCDKNNLEKPKIIGVTILTSSNQQTLSEIGIEKNIEAQVLDLAKLAAANNLDGVVASPLETRKIRENTNRNFLIVTPGIRPAASSADDQKRTLAPAEAVSEGADYLVIGRPITKAENRVQAVQSIISEFETISNS